jgi:hypothetical protein
MAKKMSKKTTTKRNIFAELSEGITAMKEHREGKTTLRTHKPRALDKFFAEISAGSENKPLPTEHAFTRESLYSDHD